MPTQATHAAKINAAIARDEAALQPVVASWQRSRRLHDLDPAKHTAPERLTSRELRESQDRLGSLLHTSKVSLDNLYSAVAGVGCSVVLANTIGAVIARRGATQDDKTFNRWGLWTGAVWSEKSEGTNGVGTCLVEQRPLTIHKDQHYHTKNTGLSCTAAPIFDHLGKLMAVIDVSSCRADLTAGFSRLISSAVTDTARRIETEHFRAQNCGLRILLAHNDSTSASHSTPQGAALIAVDGDDLVVAATKSARAIYGLTDADLETPRLLSTLHGHTPNHARDYAGAEMRVIQQALASSNGNKSAAARAMNISRATLHRKIRRYNLDA